MKAVHVSWVILIGAIGALLVSISQAITTGHLDWDAIGAALMAIIGSFTPAAQLAFPWYIPPKHQGDMPQKIEVVPKQGQ